jgi:hypothetical protein
MIVLIVIVAVCMAAGLLTGRWAAVAVVAAAIPVYYLGLNAGWWGHGVGDGWQYVLVAATLVGALTVAAAIGVRRILARSRDATPKAT